MQLTNLLHIQKPIIQGAMARISKPVLVGAVSNAGGLGVLTTTDSSAQLLQSDLKAIRQATKNPFGVNLMLQQPNISELLPVLLANPVPVVFTSAGNPAPFLKDLLDVGTLVIPVIPSVKIARKMADIGASAVVAEGMESGGHIGIETTMTLVPQVAEAVKIPVIAAGGIGTQAGVKAAFALGATGVQVGTAFLVAEETPVADNYKQLVIQANDNGTVVTGTGANRVRSLKTPLTEKLLATIDSDTFNQLSSGSLQRAISGDIEHGTFMAGQSAGMITKIQPAKAIVTELNKGVPTIIEELF
ncbi:enoyl-[acyl-carrier-protein] reductase FabK [Lactobacillus sp. LC28-10]|uniref:Probable nitronate monooxygenase n=1 Tax=Secundilactobacillus angelensis TaxID=2722706 RepID=A0ABX1KXL3_9LACO|nr:nitronate monooxygenase [Secundilactobacillus angelensis]MCH5461570.1 nitronate monooxygenase [Secundilactobacillus angelensis]NLR17865.1 enoyl-[acyl-carrier-protein] reductase FabK [Secundilactobacillus angelensis]